MERQERRRPYWRDADEQAAIEAFQDQHSSLADRVERVLIQLVVLGLVALGLVQAFQLNRLTRLAALEGVPVHEVADWSRSLEDGRLNVVSTPTSAMRLKVTSVTQRSVPGVQLLVDGKAVGDFGSGSVSVTLEAGQVLTIDATAAGEPLTFRVVEAAGLSAPVLGTSVTTRGDRQRLGVAQAAGR